MTLDTAKVKQVECPVCKAKAGEPCVFVFVSAVHQGLMTIFHYARHELAQETEND